MFGCRAPAYLTRLALLRETAAHGLKTEFDHGETIGTRSKTGTDTEQRADARRAYQDTIETSAKHSRRNVRTAWTNVRNRYGTATGVTLDAIKRLVEKVRPRHGTQPRSSTPITTRPASRRVAVASSRPSRVGAGRDKDDGAIGHRQASQDRPRIGLPGARWCIGQDRVHTTLGPRSLRVKDLKQMILYHVTNKERLAPSCGTGSGMLLAHTSRTVPSQVSGFPIAC